MTRSHCLPRAGARLSLRRRNEAGAALVEFALVVSLFAMLLYGLIAFGMILATKHTVTTAAAEAARAAVGSDDATAPVTAMTRIVKILGASNGRYKVGDDGLGPTVGPCTVGGTPADPQCITVKIIYDLDGHPVVPPAPGLGLITPPSLQSLAVVQYR